MRCFLAAVLVFLGILLPPEQAAARSKTAVVASILPVHSLVAAVMDGVGEPYLLVPGGASPHSFALRPSDARKLETSRAVFWIGPTMETFLVRPLQALARDALVVSLAGADGVTLLPFREGGPWTEHDHDVPTRPGKGVHSGEAGYDHGHADHGIDAHVWLDPLNAAAFVAAIARTLEQVDPANRAAYQTNAARVTARLRALDAELQRTLAPAKGRPYIVFHDAYQYFEARYGLSPAGSITVSPELSPGAKRLVDMRARIKADKAACVFAEPQFEPKLVRTVIQGTGARTATLDPLGARLAPGPDAYFQLLRALGTDLVECLGRRP